jgi:tetratricopeptide (TPR) repeat protein
VTALLLALALGQYTSDEARALFQEANDAFYRQDHATAEARYRKLIDAGQGGADVLYNLGTTALARGDLGEAILFLERARRLAGDEDIEANLALARSRQLDQVLGEDSAVPFTWRLADALDEPLVSGGFLAFWLLGFALLLGVRLRRPGRRLGLGLAAACAILVATALGGAVAVHASVRQRVVQAVVLAPVAKVLEFPGETARTAFEVHAGLEVRLLERSGKFVRIRLPNALEGWAPADAVAPIQP